MIFLYIKLSDKQGRFLSQIWMNINSFLMINNNIIKEVVWKLFWLVFSSMVLGSLICAFVESLNDALIDQWGNEVINTRDL